MFYKINLVPCTQNSSKVTENFTKIFEVVGLEFNKLTKTLTRGESGSKNSGTSLYVICSRIWKINYGHQGIFVENHTFTLHNKFSGKMLKKQNFGAAKPLEQPLEYECKCLFLLLRLSWFVLQNAVKIQIFDILLQPSDWPNILYYFTRN